MELFPRRRYFFCRHCGTFHFLDAPEIDGVRVLERPHAALACSICKGRLAKSLLDETHSVEYCERCRGVLMSRQTFADAVTRRRAWATGPPVQPLPIDRTELRRQIPCPVCHGGMDVHPYYGPGNVVMDSCARCDLVWLDFGELQQIVEAPGRDRGRRDAQPPRGGAAEADEQESDGPRSRRLDVLDLFRELLS